MDETRKTCRFSLSSNYADIILNNNSDFTWFNVNFKNILGDLYDEYKVFQLTLLQLGCTYIAGGNDLLEDGTINVYMNGLPFINQSGYDNSVDDSSFLISNIRFVGFTNASYNDYRKNNFLKTENVNIQIYYRSIDTDEPVQIAVGSSYPQITFLFAIQGTDEVV